MSYLRTKELKKHISGATHDRDWLTFQKKNQPIIFWPFELLVGLTIETKNVIASILGSYLQERNNDEKITQCLCVETLACFSMKHLQ